MNYNTDDRKRQKRFAKTELDIQVADRRDPPDGPLQGSSDSSTGRRHHDWGGSGGHQHHICSLSFLSTFSLSAFDNHVKFSDYQFYRGVIKIFARLFL